ncbi:unnamed protein product, partial [Gongylonema pulchrum]|uniref:Calnexin n=1 Tax=Gongylonema pulchrum TaxID=637853 RepID=A0A183DFU5_9BILA
RGIRGSNPDISDDEAGLDKYGLDQYDEESNEQRRDPLVGIATFATPMEDPDITNHVDSDEEDKEDFEIKPDDNLVAVAKVVKRLEAWLLPLLFGI